MPQRAAKRRLSGDAARQPNPLRIEARRHRHRIALRLLQDRRDYLTPKAASGAEPDRTSGRPYAQTFGKDFVPGLSILDLLFMQGPAAGGFLA